VLHYVRKGGKRENEFGQGKKRRGRNLLATALIGGRGEVRRSSFLRKKRGEGVFCHEKGGTTGSSGKKKRKGEVLSWRKNYF